MGWDFCCTYIATRIPITPDPEFWNKLGVELDSRVDKMSVEELTDWCNEIGIMDEVSEAKIKAHGIIKTVLGVLQTSARDVATFVVGEYKLWVAGGMSFGDSPGETYEEFTSFNALFTEQFIDTYLEG